MEQSEGQEQSFSGDLKEAHHVLGHVNSIEALFDKLGAVPSPAVPAPAADISSAFASVASLVSAAVSEVVPAVVSEVLSSAAAKASAAISDLAAAAKTSAAAVLSSAPAAAVALRVESVPSVEGIDIKGGMQFSYIERLCDPKLNSAFVKDRYGGRKVFINFDTLKILFGGKDPVTSIKYDEKFISCSEKGVCPKITFSEDGGDSVDAAYAKNGVLLNPANATNPGGGFNNPNKMDAMEENLCRRSNLASQLKAHEAYVGKGKYDVHLTTAHITKTTFKYSKSDKFDDSSEYKTPVDIPVVSIASPDMKEKAHLRQEEWEVEKQNYLEGMKLYWTTALQATKQASLDNLGFNPVLVAVTPGDFAKTGRVKEKDGSMKMKDGKPVIDLDIINIAAKALKDVYSTGKFNDVSIHFEQRTPTTQIFEDVLSA